MKIFSLFVTKAFVASVFIAGCINKEAHCSAGTEDYDAKICNYVEKDQLDSLGIAFNYFLEKQTDKDWKKNLEAFQQWLQQKNCINSVTWSGTSIETDPLETELNLVFILKNGSKKEKTADITYWEEIGKIRFRTFH